MFPRKNNTQLYSSFRRFTDISFGFRNETHGLDSVIYGYVRSYAIGVGYVRSARGPIRFDSVLWRTDLWWFQIEETPWFI